MDKPLGQCDYPQHLAHWLPETHHTLPGSVTGEWRIGRADLDGWTPMTDMAERGRRSAEERVPATVTGNPAQ